MIRIRGASFVDEHGRTLLLRGVNLGGSSKIPRVPDGATHLPGSLRDPAGVSFVGRPFPLSEADEHFSRLRSWGLTFLRLIVTWEAVEHAGPCIYDEAYFDYLRALVQQAGDHGISVFIDPHQDMWSRFCGGDGAPGWTLEAAGFDLDRLDATGAAFTHQRRGDPLPSMIWVTNGGKLRGQHQRPRRPVERRGSLHLQPGPAVGPRRSRFRGPGPGGPSTAMAPRNRRGAPADLLRPSPPALRVRVPPRSPDHGTHGAPCSPAALPGRVPGGGIGRKLPARSLLPSAFASLIVRPGKAMRHVQASNRVQAADGVFAERYPVS